MISPFKQNQQSILRWIIHLAVLLLLAGCTSLSPIQTPVLVASTLTEVAPTSTGVTGFTEAQIVTLNSLEQLDDYPLYTLHYSGSYASQASSAVQRRIVKPFHQELPDPCPGAWGCSLFAAFGNPESRLYGRNFDWRFSPALLLFTDPPDGYTSVSMVDIEYLGFSGEAAKNLLDLPLADRKALLDAPALPFDGMNERGLAIGMAAVLPGDMKTDPSKRTIGELAVIREILDHAATVDEAIKILGLYNIDMGTVPIHYLIASADGSSALVEFYQGEMVVQKNDQAWQMATNFIVASTNGKPQGNCPRYDRITERLLETLGKLSVEESMALLNEVSQDNTQWSIIYDMTSGVINVVMGMNYSQGPRIFQLEQANE